MTLVEEFNAKVDRGPHPSGCFLWMGGKSNGYGMFLHNGKLEGAHRIAWRLEFGPIPEKLFVCHSCDNPTCVNAAHLFLGTARDNVRDMYNKERGRKRFKPLTRASRSRKAFFEDIKPQQEKLNVANNWQYERTLTARQFKRVIKQLGMSEAGAGRYIGVSLRTVRRMGKGQAIIPASAVLLLRSLVAHGEQPVVPKWERE